MEYVKIKSNSELEHIQYIRILERGAMQMDVSFSNITYAAVTLLSVLIVSEPGELRLVEFYNYLYN